MPSSTRRKIAIFSHCGNGNLGDDALFSAVIQNVRMRLHNSEIIGFTYNPEDSQRQEQIPVYPIRRSTPARSTAATESDSASTSARLRGTIKAIPGLATIVRASRSFFRAVAAVPGEVIFLFKSYRRLRGVDMMLVAGSQQLSDHFGGPWGFPYTVFKFTLLARLSGARVALLSVGVGPLKAPLSRFFARRVLNMVAYRSYRDGEASRFAMELGVKGSHPVLPDLVYSLQLPTPKQTAEKMDRPIVGLNPLPFYDERYWHVSDAARYSKYVAEFAKFGDWLTNHDHAVLFFGTQIHSDVLTADDIRSAMKEPSSSPKLLSGRKIENVQDLVSEISRADLVVANRYHGILFSLAMNKPVLALIYHEKGRALMAQMGQGDYVISDDDLTAEEMIKRFEALKTNAGAIRKQLAAQLVPFRKALDDQYDTVLRLIGGSAALSFNGEAGAGPAVESLAATSDSGADDANTTHGQQGLYRRRYGAPAGLRRA